MQANERRNNHDDALGAKSILRSQSEGLDLFVNGLGFKVLHQEASLAVVVRDEAKAYVESSEYAAKDRPEIAIETDTIDELYKEVSSKRPDLLHPNSRAVMKKPCKRRPKRTHLMADVAPSADTVHHSTPERFSWV
jgi:hypothetical protein